MPGRPDTSRTCHSPLLQWLVELLNLANANAYYSNQCLWTRRPYAAWQNTDASREEAARDASGQRLAARGAALSLLAASDEELRRMAAVGVQCGLRARAARAQVTRG